MLGLGGRGNLSEVPEFGGVNAEGGRRGSSFGPFLRPWIELGFVFIVGGWCKGLEMGVKMEVYSLNWRVKTKEDLGWNVSIVRGGNCEH